MPNRTMLELHCHDCGSDSELLLTEGGYLRCLNCIATKWPGVAKAILEYLCDFKEAPERALEKKFIQKGKNMEWHKICGKHTQADIYIGSRDKHLLSLLLAAPDLLEASKEALQAINEPATSGMVPSPATVRGIWAAALKLKAAIMKVEANGGDDAKGQE